MTYIWPGPNVEVPGESNARHVFAEPALVSISPVSAIAGAAAVALDCYGYDFSDDCVIVVDGVDKATAHGADRAIHVSTVLNLTAVPAGPLAITIRNGSGQTSRPTTFTVRASLGELDAPAADNNAIVTESA